MKIRHKHHLLEAKVKELERALIETRDILLETRTWVIDTRRALIETREAVISANRSREGSQLFPDYSPELPVPLDLYRGGVDTDPGPSVPLSPEGGNN